MLAERYQGEKTIRLLLESDYNKVYRHLQLDKKALLMDPRQHFVQTPWDEKLRLEESMVKKALEIIDEEEQLFIIQNEIHKFITEAETVNNILKNEEGISEKKLKKQLIRDLKIPKISNNRLNLIKEFIKRRIST